MVVIVVNMVVVIMIEAWLMRGSHGYGINRYKYGIVIMVTDGNHIYIYIYIYMYIYIYIYIYIYKVMPMMTINRQSRLVRGGCCAA